MVANFRMGSIDAPVKLTVKDNAAANPSPTAAMRSDLVTFSSIAAGFSALHLPRKRAADGGVRCQPFPYLP